MTIADRVAEVTALLTNANIYVLDQEPIQHGVRLLLHNDSLVNVYTSGTVQVQGKNHDATAAALGALVAQKRARPAREVEGAATPAKNQPVVDGMSEAWRFCVNCDALLVSLWKHCVWCGEPTFSERSTVACNCAAELDPAWHHCPRCGVAVGSQQ